MRNRGSFYALVRYFFGRFFENDLIEASGDTSSTIVRALAMAAAPGLLVAFFLQNQYPQRPAWGRVEDHYFFVLYSTLVMTGAATFEWETLFADRLDFLVLGPLPLPWWKLLAAKTVALAGFLGLFLFAANFFGALLLPAVSHAAFWRTLAAHTVAVAGAGAFGALAVTAAGGVLLCILPTRGFRLISPILRAVLVMTLGLLLVHYLRFGDELNTTLAGSLGRTTWVPTFWFLGLYERVLHGAAAMPFALSMEHRAFWALAMSAACVLVTYPLAWIRMQRIAIESDGERRRRGASRIDAFIAGAAHRPENRALLPFIGQTMARINKYQVYLAMYGGAGGALAVACACTIVNGNRVAISMPGLHAVLPLLIFWVVAGVRMAFALPLNLPARWVFRMTAADRERCIDAGREWTMFCCLILIALLLPILWAGGMGARVLLVQSVCAATLAALIVDGLMFANAGIPFAQPRSPGKTSLPLMLTLFIGVMPIAIFGLARMEILLEGKLLYLLAAPASAWTIHQVVRFLRRRSQPLLEDGDEIEPDFELLHLGVD